jgi:hypothetical protein
VTWEFGDDWKVRFVGGQCPAAPSDGAAPTAPAPD